MYFRCPGMHLHYFQSHVIYISIKISNSILESVLKLTFISWLQTLHYIDDSREAIHALHCTIKLHCKFQGLVRLMKFFHGVAASHSPIKATSSTSALLEPTDILVALWLEEFGLLVPNRTVNKYTRALNNTKVNIGTVGTAPMDHP